MSLPRAKLQARCAACVQAADAQTGLDEEWVSEHDKNYGSTRWWYVCSPPED